MHPIITEHFITSTSDKMDEYRRIVIDNKRSNYFINNKGDIKKVSRSKTIKGRYVHTDISKYNARGYWLTNIKTNDGHAYLCRVHRLIACLFIPVPRDLLEAGYSQQTLMVNHIDGDKGNYDIDNLEWATPKWNTQHAFLNGLCNTSMGEDSHLAKISEEDARKICELLQEGYRPSEIGEEFGYPLYITRHIYSGETWKQLSKEYDFSKVKERTDNSAARVLQEKIKERDDVIIANNEHVQDIINGKVDYSDANGTLNTLVTRKKKVSKSVIVTSTHGDHTWYRLVIDGHKTKYEINRDGIVRLHDSKEVLTRYRHNKLCVYPLVIPEIREKPIEFSIARLIASIFLPVPKELKEQGILPENLKVGFIDGKKDHYELSNLKWEIVIAKTTNSKITEEDAIKICEMLKAGLTPKAIAEQCGYSIHTIRRIRSGQLWSEIANQYGFNGPVFTNRADLPEETVRAICELLELKKYSLASIAARYNISRATVGKIKNRKRYVDISKNYIF